MEYRKQALALIDFGSISGRAFVWLDPDGVEIDSRVARAAQLLILCRLVSQRVNKLSNFVALAFDLLG